MANDWIADGWIEDGWIGAAALVTGGIELNSVKWAPSVFGHSIAAGPSLEVDIGTGSSLETEIGGLEAA